MAPKVDKTETPKMMMNEALDQIGKKGLIIKKMTKNAKEIENFASESGSIIPELGSEDKHREAVASLIQSSMDHVINYEQLKERIEYTNLNSKLTIHGVTKSVTAWRAFQQMLYPSIKLNISSMNGTKGAQTRMSVRSNQMEDKGIKLFYDNNVKEKMNADVDSLFETLKARLETFNATTELMELP